RPGVPEAGCRRCRHAEGILRSEAVTEKPSFLAELQRRNVLRAGVLYAGAVWAVAHSTGRKLDKWIIAVLVVAVVLLLTNTFVWRKGAGLANDSALANIPAK